MTEIDTLIGISTAIAPGACGELAQGMLDGKPFLITCPIDLFATATVELRQGAGKVVAPITLRKAARAVELTMAYLREAGADITLRVDSPLPRGKGMASSTADVAASIVATADVLGARLTSHEVAEIALRVEPSDGLMYPGIARFDHRHGSLAMELGDPPPMQVVVLDFGGTVDTLRFNDLDVTEALAESENDMREAVRLISQGVAESNVSLIGRGSTISARANQAILPKRQLESVIALASEAGAAGVNVAHSGTVIGMLFEDDGPRVQHAASLAWTRLLGLKAVGCQRVIGGGVAAAATTKEVMRI